MGAYYELIMEPSPGSFPTVFRDCWSQKLDDLNVKYANATQMRIGNRLRPKLTCWGAALGTKAASEINLEAIAQIAVHIELLHKASIIIDDMVDKDEARHGKTAFHIEYGSDHATLFALALLGEGASGINLAFGQALSQSGGEPQPCLPH